MDITANCINGELKPGDLVLSTSADDYEYLVGTVLEIQKVGTPEHETGNPADDIHVNFMDSEYSPHRIREIEGMLSKLYDEPKTFGEAPLDDTIMSPDSLIRITGIGPDLLRSILSSEYSAKALCELVEDGLGVVQTPSDSEKLYSPLTFYIRDYDDAEEGVYDERDYWRDEIYHDEAYEYIGKIRAALDDDRQHYDNGRGLAEYLDGALNDKVQSLVPHIELHSDKLWTVAHLQLGEPLNDMEMAELKFWWEGQLSDGWGEGFEQREIKVDRGDLYVEPWSAERDFFINTQAEFDRRMGIERPAPTVTLPPQEPAPDLDAMKQQLFSRLDKNLSDFCEAIVNTDKRELIGMAEEIATRFAVRDYLKSDHRFHASELELLLRFRSPLTVVSEHTPPVSKLLDMSGAISELANLDGALRREYPMEQQFSAIQESFGARDDLLAQIARKHCRVETLEERKSDSLDFHDVSVWGLKAALQEAFAAGAAQQLAQQKTTELAPAEPGGPAPKEILFSRFEQNLSDMMRELRSEITTPGLSQKDLTELAERIAATNSAYEYLTGGNYLLDSSQVDYLLQFQNPLEVVADNWPTKTGGIMDLSYLVDDVFDRQDALQEDYPLVAADNTQHTAQEPPNPPTTGKPSLLAGLREAKAKSEQQKSTPSNNKSEPEL